MLKEDIEQIFKIINEKNKIFSVNIYYYGITDSEILADSNTITLLTESLLINEENVGICYYQIPYNRIFLIEYEI